MSQSHQGLRRKRVFVLTGFAVLLWLILGLTSLTTRPADNQHARIGDPVLSDFGRTRADAQKIRFTLADERYTLARTASGWTLEETGGYPVRPDRLAELAGGLETLSFDQAISQEDRRLKTQDYPDLSTNPFAYQRRGLYADMLKPFIQELPAGQLKIVSFDDLKARPESVLSELYEFVGVDSKFRPAGLHEKHNAHSQDNLRISHETLDRMLNFFLEPNQRLETILGQNLGAWNDASQLAEELLKH